MTFDTFTHAHPVIFCAGLALVVVGILWNKMDLNRYGGGEGGLQ